MILIVEMNPGILGSYCTGGGDIFCYKNATQYLSPVSYKIKIISFLTIKKLDFIGISPVYVPFFIAIKTTDSSSLTCHIVDFN